jgi:hypothetical protein
MVKFESAAKYSKSRSFFEKFQYADVYFEKSVFDVENEDNDQEKIDPTINWSGGPCNLKSTDVYPPALQTMKQNFPDENSVFKHYKDSKSNYPIPRDIDKYLTVVYGKNWSVIPLRPLKHGQPRDYACIWR